MIDRLLEAVPERWRDLAEAAAAPIAWLPALHQALVAFFAASPSPWAAVLKYAFLAPPAALAVVALWCTQLALYTLPFRAARARFVSLLLLAWWDAGRMVWLYWLGVARVAAVATGWVFALGALAARLMAALAATAAAGPAALRARLHPHAVGAALLLAWCALEAAALTVAVRPALARAIAELPGVEDAGRIAGPLLFAALFVLVLGSFACLHALGEALRGRRWSLLAQLTAVQVFVVVFEVVFLYRPLARALAPALAEGPDRPFGLAATLALAGAGWVGVRGLTWAVVGREGTARVLAAVTGRPVAAPAAPGPASAPGWWRAAVAEFRREIDWLHARSEEALEFLTLPVLQLLAAALNFTTILVTGRPAFTLPLAGLREVTAQRDLDAAAHAPPHRPASA